MVFVSDGHPELAGQAVHVCVHVPGAIAERRRQSLLYVPALPVVLRACDHICNTFICFINVYMYT